MVTVNFTNVNTYNKGINVRNYSDEFLLEKSLHEDIKLKKKITHIQENMLASTRVTMINSIEHKICLQRFFMQS